MQFCFVFVRHGSGNRPDARGTNLLQLKLSSTHHLLETDDCKSNTNKRNANDSSSDGEAQNNGNISHSGSTYNNNYSSGSPSRVVEPPHAQFQRSRRNTGTFRDQTVGKDNHNQGVLSNGSPSHLESELLSNDTHGRFRFARTHSSPELTDPFGDTAVIFVPSAQDHDTADSDSGFHNHQQSALYVPNEELSSSSSIAGTLQEEQDLVNIMASANLNGFSGHVPVPFNLASMGYNLHNLPTMVSSNVYPYANFQFPHGSVTSHLTPYYPGYAMSSASDDAAGQSNDNSSPMLMNLRDFKNGHWQERDAPSTGAFDLGNGNHERLHQDDKLQKVASDVIFFAPPWVNSSGNSFNEPSLATGRHESVWEANNLQLQDDRAGDYYADERAVSSRFSSAAHSDSLRSKSCSESSWNGSSKSTKGKTGKKGLSSEPAIAYDKGKLISGSMSNRTEVDELKGNSVQNMPTENTSRSPGPQTVASFHRFLNSYHEASQANSSDSIVPIASMLIGPGSQQNMADSLGLVAFYPTGPPIPFLTMMPVYNRPHEAGNSDALRKHFARVEALGNSVSGQNTDSPGGPDQSDDFRTSSSPRGMGPDPKSDILNSDFASHWQNLQFGRFCQNPRNETGHPIYPSPLRVPPVYLQGGFPLDGSGRPLSANMDIVSQLIGYGPCLTAVAPVQSLSTRPPSVYQCYVDEIPRQRHGTGTYLPNPKLSAWERHSSGNRRGSYKSNRNDNHSDREGNWNANGKPRNTPHSQNRDQAEKLNPRLDRLPSEGRADRAWTSHGHDSHPSYRSQNSALRSNASNKGPRNLAYGMYSTPTMRANGASLSYPNVQNSNFGSHGKQLGFGSLGPQGFSSTKEESHLSEGSQLRRSLNNPRFHGRSDHRSPPNHPSSPPNHPSSPHHRR
ncbi:hypothetical protein Leryth_015019 [Lithospermum erythrorhizon]|nr:hypothetical protein Leryth_015019 [Lithospermum erythrorhizon]